MRIRVNSSPLNFCGSEGESQRSRTAARGAAGGDPCTQWLIAKCRARHFALGLPERLAPSKRCAAQIFVLGHWVKGSAPCARRAGDLIGCDDARCFGWRGALTRDYDDDVSELAAWDSFYVIVGSAAGALIGLQFVVMMLIAGKPQLRVAEAGAAFSTPTLIHFGAALLLSALMRVPWPSVIVAAAVWGIA